MFPRTSVMKLVAVLVLVSAAVACGDKGSPTSPAASLTSSSTGPGGAVVTGQVNGVSIPSREMANNASGLVVTVEGTNLSATISADGRFELHGVPSGEVILRFSGTGINATITLTGITSEELIDILVALAGTGANIEVEQRTTPDRQTSLEGKITAVNLGAQTFEVGGRAVSVTSATTIRNDLGPLTFSALQLGVRVHVRGTMSGSTLVASVVQVQSDDMSNVVEVEGMLTAVTGACPAVTLSIGTTSVLTSSLTTFSAGTCADLVVGAKVEIRALRQTDGSLLAQVVKVEQMTVDLEGQITSVNTAAMTFVLGGETVKVTAATIIRHGSVSLQFSDLKVGFRVHVKGLRAAGVFTASEIQVQNDNPVPPSTEVTLKGAVTAVSLGCPAPSFTVSGTAITTTVLTTFVKGKCGDVKVGASLELKGIKQPDNSVAASWIKFD